MKKTSFDGQTIKSSDTAELFRIALDKNINFRRHIQNIYHKANNKTKALFCVRKFLNLEQAQVLAEAHVHQVLETVHWFGCFAAKWVAILLWKTITENLRLYMIHKHDHMKNY